MAKNDSLQNALRRLLASWTVYYTKTHVFHWNVVGNNFFSLHAEFETLYKQAVESQDSIAERMRQLEIGIPTNLSECLELSEVTDANEDNTEEGMCRNLLEAMVQLGVLQNEIWRMTNSSEDNVTNDLMIQLNKFNDFHMWWIRSFLNAKSNK